MSSDTPYSSEIPETIQIDKINYINFALVDELNFIKVILKESPKFVGYFNNQYNLGSGLQVLHGQGRGQSYFSCFCSNCCVLTYSYEFTQFKDFYEAVTIFHNENTHFESFKEFSTPFQMGIKSLEAFQLFQRTNFYNNKLQPIENKKNYQDFLGFIKRNMKLSDDTQNDKLLDLLSMELNGFIRSEFNKEYFTYEDYVSAKTRGFIDVESYQNAKLLGIETLNDYLSFKESNFFPNTSDMENKKFSLFFAEPMKTEQQKRKFNELLSNNYRIYVKAKPLGFPDIDSYENANKLGFQNYPEYLDFIKSGCSSKEEYNNYLLIKNKELPRLKKQFDEAIKESRENYENQNYQESFRLGYLAIEVLFKLKYLIVKNSFPPKDALLEDLLREIEQSCNRSLIKNEEITKWRRIRNQIIHDNLKLEIKEYEKAQDFFDNMIKKMDEIAK